MPKEDEVIKPKNQTRPKKTEPQATGVKKVLEERRVISPKPTVQAPKIETKKGEKLPSLIDTLTHIPEQILDAEAKMMAQVQPNKELEKELEKEKKLSDERLEQINYLRAEFDNYRKWNEKEKLEFVKSASEGLMKNLLTFLDEFEISISAIKDEKMKESFVLMQKNLLKILQSRGLEKIEAMDKKFDPYFHEVVMMQPSDKLEGTVLFEVQKGYKLNGKVLRYSKVVVSAGTPKTA